MTNNKEFRDKDVYEISGIYKLKRSVCPNTFTYEKQEDQLEPDLKDTYRH